MIPRSLLPCLLAAALVLAGGCGDSSAPQGDAGLPARRLVLVGPGPDLGLKPGQTYLLAVRYETAQGLTLAAQKLTFAIYGDPRGTTLSSDTSLTNGQGLASVEVRAGAAETAFEVRVQGRDAPPLIVGVQVSKAGFAALAVRPRYLGKLLQSGELARVDVRLLAGARCKTVTAGDASPALRERSLLGLDGEVVFAALPVAQAYTVAATASDAQQRWRAYGCLELPPQLLRESDQVRLELPLDDAPPRLIGRYELVSELTLPTANRPLAAALAPWSQLRHCPHAPAQRLLDCILDALDPGDPLDCVISAPSPAAQALLQERGMLAGGCRPETTSAGGPTIDRRLSAAMEAQGKSLLAALVDLEPKAAAVLGQLRLRSELTVTASDGLGHALATHRPLELTFPAGATAASYELSAVALPLPVAPAVGLTLGGWVVTVEPHAVSLRPGVLLRRALGDVLLAPEGLPASSATLVQALADLVTTTEASPKTGCAAIDQIACGAARLPAGCLVAACQDGLQAAAAQLDAGFVALDDHRGADLELAGHASLSDSDGKLAVDRIGGGPDAPMADRGRWTTARLRLADEAVDAKQATFTGKGLP